MIPFRMASSSRADGLVRKTCAGTFHCATFCKKISFAHSGAQSWSAVNTKTGLLATRPQIRSASRTLDSGRILTIVCPAGGASRETILELQLGAARAHMCHHSGR